MASDPFSGPRVLENVSGQTDRKYVRIYKGSAAAGQLAHITAVGDGYIDVDTVWDWSSKIVPGEGGAVPCMWKYIYESWGYGAPEYSGWNPDKLPQADDEYVLIDDSQWSYFSDPMAVTAYEVLNDSDLWYLNLTLINNKIAGIMQTLYLASNSSTPVEFVRVPVIYWGLPGPSVVRAFTPNAANAQVACDTCFFPKQWGPQDQSGDILEAQISGLQPNCTFLDTWNCYHVMSGEVHCASAVRRSLPDTEWWEQQRGP